MMSGKKGWAEGRGPQRVGVRGAVTIVSGGVGSGGWVELGDLSIAVMEVEGDNEGRVGKGKR